MSKLSNLVNGSRRSKRVYGFGCIVRRSDTHDDITAEGKTHDMSILKSNERQKYVDAVIHFLRGKGFFDRKKTASDYAQAAS